MTALLSDFVALGVTVLIVAAFLSFIRNLRNVHGVAPALTRKLAHAGTGILFLICWGLFSANAESKYVAGIVPAFTTARFVMVGVGLLNDPAVRSLGARDQLVRGPLAYGVVFTALTIFYWRHVVALLVAVALCLGDGAVTALALSNAAPKQPNLRRAVSALIFFVVCVGAALLSIALARLTGWFAPRGELPIADLYLSLFVAATGALVELLQPHRSRANVVLAAAILFALRFLQWWLGPPQ
jgi:phytol kinase